nr:MAG TPA: portal protein [Caudoviricetes sp.]
MNIFTRVKEFIMNLFKTNAEKEFNVDIISSDLMEIAQAEWQNVIKGRPYWMSKNVRTINFAKFLCYYTSKKTCLDLNVTINGSDRADYIDQCIKAMIQKSIRDKVEDACGAGGIILKPNGTYNPAGAIDYVMPGSFAVTEKNSNGDILGIIFIDRRIKGDDYYTRLEYQHFTSAIGEDGENAGRTYTIENKAFKSRGSDSLGRSIKLTDVPEWKDIPESISISNVEKPLFGYFKMPYNNTIDYASPEGVAVFSNCLEELRNLDVAWSRKDAEVDDSQHLTFIDENALTKRDKNNGSKERVELPRFVKGLRRGVDAQSTIDEHVPTLLTDQRVADINSILSMISTKAGFSQGQFVLDRKTGIATATEIESDDSETVETITDIRNALKAAIKDLVYALDKYCDVFFDMPSGYVNALDEGVADEDIFYFKDLLASFEQDRTRAYQLAMNKMYSKRKYLKEYEGFNDQEIDEMFAEIEKENAGEQSGLFGEE